VEFSFDVRFLTSEEVLGIDPSWPLPERVSRMVDIEQGSGRMSEEVVRGADYARQQAKV